MPELLITAGRDRRPFHSTLDLDEWSYVTLSGRMLFPNDNNKFEEYYEVALTDAAIRNKMEILKRIEPELERLGRLLGSLKSVSSSSPDERLSANKDKRPLPIDSFTRRINLEYGLSLKEDGNPIGLGLRAGKVLLTLKRIFDHPKRILGREPSLDQAFAVSAAIAGVVPRTMRLAWQEYRSVSHFWAAQCVLLPASTGGGLPSVNNQAQILSLGEVFLTFSDTHMTGSGPQSKPILGRDEAWHLPDDFEIGQEWREEAESQIDGLPPLTDDEVKALRGYRAEYRQ